MPVAEATIEETDAGALATSDGWFVLNSADVMWKRKVERRGIGGLVVLLVARDARQRER